MPLVEVTMVEGRTPEQLRSLIHALHEAVVHAVAAPPENVRVVVREVPPTHWAAGDVTISERLADVETPTRVSVPDRTERRG
ncbi:hypothetical protein GCM10009535_54190 [Streptomyces thermocarboxydovorans]|uniref:4-oxalocrotonate tautomerase-like domain-containing protein n=1 Tax=Streptomyces thermocarboxydovorans TaxID=59298 RepID=A0ABN1HTY9_9ACTN